MASSVQNYHEFLNLFDEEEICLIGMLYRRAKRRRRSCWVHAILNRRRQLGEYYRLVQELRLDRDRFQRYFRMNTEQFDKLLSMVGPQIAKQNTRLRKTISPAERLAITLRFLATGDSYQTIACSYRVGASTIAGRTGIVAETCEAVWDCLAPVYMKVPTEDDWRKNAQLFHQRWNFPNCIGAIGGKHVEIQAPPNSGSLFFNYKGAFSIVLLALVDADYYFSVIDVGAYGKSSDAGVLADSSLGKSLQRQSLRIPPDSPLPGSEEEEPCPHVIVADEAFPLSRNMMRPYPGKHLPVDKRTYNYRHSRARRIVDNAFGILASRWRLYRRVIEIQPDNVDKAVRATCVLQNYLRRENGPQEDRIAAELRRESVECRALTEMPRVSSSNATREAIAVRDKFKDYFCSPAGSVPWQVDIVHRGEFPAQ